MIPAKCKRCYKNYKQNYSIGISGVTTSLFYCKNCVNKVVGKKIINDLLPIKEQTLKCYICQCNIDLKYGSLKDYYFIYFTGDLYSKDKRILFCFNCFKTCAGKEMVEKIINS